MSLVHRLRTTASRFRSDKSGQFGMIFALCSGVLMISVGLSIDFTRIISAKSQLTSALDAAVTSTARDITRGKIKKDEAAKIVQAFLEANLDGRRLSKENVHLTDVTLDPVTNEISAAARVDVAIMFPVMNLPKVQPVNVKIGALYSERKVEVSMVLDVTGSMEDFGKIGELKIAAKSAVKAFLENGSDNTRVAITPYSFGVNSGPYRPFVMGEDRGPAMDFCATERRGAEMFSDAGPAVEKVTRADFINYFDDKSGEVWPIPMNSKRCPTVAVQPLTKDKAVLNAMIDKLSPVGGTAGHIGLQWGWYMIAPNWPEIVPDSKPVAYDAPDSEKYIILMTDGMFNSEASDLADGDVRSFAGISQKSGRLAMTYCDEIKNKDVKVYTIGFRLNDISKAAQREEAVRMLDDCATDPVGSETTFYNAENGAELKQAFDDIARRIQTLRLTN